MIAGLRCVARGVHDFETLSAVHVALHYAILFVARFAPRAVLHSAVRCASKAWSGAAVRCVSKAWSAAAARFEPRIASHAGTHCGFVSGDGLCAG